jgi:tetratricopeptide (TPR) repeat protein
MMEERAGNYAAGVEQYRKVLEVAPNQFVALNNLAYRLVNDLNQPDEALKYAQQAKEAAPNHASVEDTIGWAFYRKGIYRTAVLHLENAAAKSPDPVIKFHLAMAYLKAGNRERGQETLKLALRVNPDLPEARMAQQVLAETQAAK